MKTIFFDLDGTLTDLSKKPNLQLLVKEEVLLLLSKKYQLGLITGSRDIEVRFALQNLDIAKYFQPDLTITADTCPFPKMTGKPFIMAKEKVTEAIAMIGDSESDRIGSKKAEIPFVLITDFNSELFLN